MSTRQCRPWSDLDPQHLLSPVCLNTLGYYGNVYAYFSKQIFLLHYTEKYRIYPKYGDISIPYHTCPKIWKSPFSHLLMCSECCWMSSKHCRPWSDATFWILNLNVPIFFLFLFLKNVLWYSFEAHQGSPNEYPQYMFLLRNKKNILLIPHLIWICGTSHNWHFSYWYVLTFFL